MDDQIYCGAPSNIYSVFHFLCDIHQPLGLDVNPKKLVTPTTSVVCLGTLVDSETRTMSVSPEKLEIIVQMYAGLQIKNFVQYNHGLLLV